MPAESWQKCQRNKRKLFLLTCKFLFILWLWSVKSKNVCVMFCNISPSGFLHLSFHFFFALNYVSAAAVWSHRRGGCGRKLFKVLLLQRDQNTGEKQVTASASKTILDNYQVPKHILMSSNCSYFHFSVSLSEHEESSLHVWRIPFTVCM